MGDTDGLFLNDCTDEVPATVAADMAFPWTAAFMAGLAEQEAEPTGIISDDRVRTEFCEQDLTKHL